MRQAPSAPSSQRQPPARLRVLVFYLHGRVERISAPLTREKRRSLLRFGNARGVQTFRSGLHLE